MLNYQKFHYRHYYVQDANGECREVTRKECFAKPEEPTATLPFKQRWLYDLEAGYACRLERSRQGEDLYRMNATSLKREERQQERRAKMADLDKTYEGDSEDNLDSRFEIADSFDLASYVADKFLFEELYAALAKLTADDADLVQALYVDQRTERDYAAELGLSHQAVGKRRKKVLVLLREILGDQI